MPHIDLPLMFVCLFVCFGDQDICRGLAFNKPVIVQSMYIFKQPGIGGVGKKYKLGFFDHDKMS